VIFGQRFSGRSLAQAKCVVVAADTCDDPIFLGPEVPEATDRAAVEIAPKSSQKKKAVVRDKEGIPSERVEPKC
jgi:hypothetical protein